MPQSLASILVHIIFSTKNREPFLADDDLRHRVHAYMAAVLSNMDCRAHLVGGTADHAHILCELARTRALADVVREVKRASSKWTKTQGGLRDFRWQNGYGAFSVSWSNMHHVRAYIRAQEQHHRRHTFQDELRLLMEKHAVDYDERYVWD